LIQGNNAFYEIQVKGRLDAWPEELFDGMTVVTEGDVTTVSGLVADQAGLHGLPARVRDFGLVLLSVKPVESEQGFF
jgi:hypothetical protein